MAKVRYSPPRIHANHRLELPEHLAQFPEEFEALPDGTDTYDAKRISQMAANDPGLRQYIEDLVTGRIGRTGGRANDRGASPKRGVSQTINRYAGAGSSGSGSRYDDGPRYGFAQGNAFMGDITNNYGVHVEPDDDGGFYGWFHVSRRFLYVLAVLLFLIFLAIYHVPGVLDFFFDVVN